MISYSRIVAPFILALGTVGVLNIYLRDLRTRSSTQLDEGLYKNNVADFASKIAIGLFLPLIFIDAIAQRPEVFSSHWWVFFIGIILPFVTLAFAEGLGFFGVNISNNVWFPPFASTFGGGNRGTLLLIILTTLISVDVQEYLPTFYMLDLGNFLVLVMIMPRILSMKVSRLGIVGSASRGASQTRFLVETIGFGVPIVVGLILLLMPVLFDTTVVQEVVSNVLSLARDEIRIIFIFLVYTSILLRARLNDISVSTQFSYLGYWVMSRLLSLLLVGSIIYMFIGMPFTIENVLNIIQSNPLMFAVTLLLVLPPSSIFPGLLANSSEPTQMTNDIDAMSIVFLVLYLIALFVLLIVIGVR